MSHATCGICAEEIHAYSYLWPTNQTLGAHGSCIRTMALVEESFSKLCDEDSKASWDSAHKKAIAAVRAELVKMRQDYPFSNFLKADRGIQLLKHLFDSVGIEAASPHLDAARLVQQNIKWHAERARL